VLQLTQPLDGVRIGATADGRGLQDVPEVAEINTDDEEVAIAEAKGRCGPVDCKLYASSFVCKTSCGSRPFAALLCLVCIRCHMCTCWYPAIMMQPIMLSQIHHDSLGQAGTLSLAPPILTLQALWQGMSFCVQVVLEIRHMPNADRGQTSCG
jgi:hypothetical protein